MRTAILESSRRPNNQGVTTWPRAMSAEIPTTNLSPSRCPIALALSIRLNALFTPWLRAASIAIAASSVTASSTMVASSAAHIALTTRASRPRRIAFDSESDVVSRQDVLTDLKARRILPRTKPGAGAGLWHAHHDRRVGGGCIGGRSAGRSRGFVGRAIHGSVYQLRSPLFREILAPFSYELAVAASAWYGGLAIPVSSERGESYGGRC